MQKDEPFQSNNLKIAIFGALFLLSFAQLVLQFTGYSFALDLSRMAFLALFVSMVPIFKFREWALCGFSIALIFGLSQKQDGWSDISFALDRAAFFAAFIYLVTLLKEAAQNSHSVLKLGTYLTNQPPGRRYYSLAFGGHTMGVLLNFGAISLLTPLIQRGVRAKTKHPIQASKLEQQQISSLIRGFSWMIMWSPTALTQAVLFTSFPDTNLWLTIPLGIAAALVMIFIGRIEDRLRWQGNLLETPLEILEFPTKAAKRFLTICVLLIGATFIVAYLAEVSAALGLMLVAPFVMVGWIFEQNFKKPALHAAKKTISDLSSILTQSSIVLGRSAITLGAAGFIGEAAARLAPIDVFAVFLEQLSLQSWMILIALPLIITLCGQIALSPILIVVFLASVFNQLPVLPADPSLIVFALGAGWAMSMLASPNASATLLISGVTGIAPTTLTWRWNGLYALICYLVFIGCFYLLDKQMSYIL